MPQSVSRRAILGAGAAAALIGAGCAPKSPTLDAQVIILGAGLAGLQAARILSDDGYDVLVLEASSRIGGRLHTLTHDDGSYSEAGGEQIGASYARILDAAMALGLTLTPDADAPAQMSYHHDGVLYDPQSWNTLGPTGGRSPASLFFGAAAKANPLSAPQDWRDPAFADYDTDAHAFLKSAGLPAIQIAMIEHTANCNALGSYSMMNVYRSLQLYAQSRGMGPSLSIEGGAQRLPEAMAQSLARPVMTRARVTGFIESSDHVTVQTQSGKSYRAPHLICALPFGAMQNLRIKAPLANHQRRLMKALPYTQILQIHCRAKLPFWERDGLPANMTTDGPLERLFAMSGPDGAPNGLLRFWVNGDGAMALSGMTDAQLYSLASQELKRIRPESGGQIDGLRVIRWLRNNPLAGGAYMHFAPTVETIAAKAQTMAQSTPRIHFAGEHLSYLHTGMEGAMESGEAAAFKILGA